MATIYEAQYLQGAPCRRSNAILNRNAPAFYCVAADAYEAMMEKFEDLELNAVADARSGQPVIKVTLDDL